LDQLLRFQRAPSSSRAQYRDALAAGEPPTRAVSVRYGVARSTAGRWIAEARRRGELGKARPRIAGEIDQEGKS
jgi:hypothetical protein